MPQSLMHVRLLPDSFFLGGGTAPHFL